MALIKACKAANSGFNGITQLATITTNNSASVTVTHTFLDSGHKIIFLNGVMAGAGSGYNTATVKLNGETVSPTPYLCSSSGMGGGCIDYNAYIELDISVNDVLTFTISATTDNSFNQAYIGELA